MYYGWYLVISCRKPVFGELPAWFGSRSELDPFQICVDWPKTTAGWKAMLLRSTFMGPNQISMDPNHRPIPRIPAKPNRDRLEGIYELTFRKFQKLGRLTSFTVVFLIETSFPFYEWYTLRLLSFNTITVIYIYKGGGRRVEGRGGWGMLFSVLRSRKN